MHILLELHMWENRYRQFKDQSWNCTCGKRGSNQKVELHMWENVSPDYWTGGQGRLPLGLDSPAQPTKSTWVELDLG